MKLRTALAAALAALALAPAQAQQFPNRAIRIIVPYNAGGPADLLARTASEKASPRLGQPIVIENKPGAGGHIGGEMVARAEPDGYTLVLATIAHNGASKLYRNLSYDPRTDLQPVILLAESPSVLIVHNDVPVKSVPELLALAREKPGQVYYGSAGGGSAMHMAAELFRYMTKIDYVHVPYKGGAPAMRDLLAGRVHMLFESVGTAHKHLSSGKIRPIAVTSTKRNPSLPDVPTVAESGVPGYASVPWYTISTAKGVPASIVGRLNAAFDAAVKSPELAERWAKLGVLPLGGTPQEAAARNEVEFERWSKVIEAAGLKVD
ncbi:MAG: Bug family tripartite tricarboxylate transporter substrate binding protein [Burkholderiales bacterium]